MQLKDQDTLMEMKTRELYEYVIELHNEIERLGIVFRHEQSEVIQAQFRVEKLQRRLVAMAKLFGELD